MTTSDAPPAPRIWVVGRAGVGKKSLVAALGGVAKKPHPQEAAIAEYTWSGAPGVGGPRVTIALCAGAAMWRGECARGDVVVLVFDVTDHASFDAVVRDWAPLVSAQTHTLLVGTRLDRAAAERAVPASDAMELALVECDDFVEVCATRPPFEGVVYARQLLVTWLSQENPPSVPKIATPLSSPSSKQPRAGVRSSVWLYDPTEEVEVAGHDDVKLRPISRALFEMREAGSDRVKTQERRREQAVAKLVGRSRYHGPTESSRSMRWQAHQLQLQQQQQQQHARRQSAADVDIRHAHAALESKSFLQPTKVMQQRVDEIRHRLLASTEKPQRRAVAKTRTGDLPTRPRASSTAPPPPPAQANSTPTRVRAPSLSLSPSKSPPRSRFSLQRSPPRNVVSDEVALDLLSSPLAPLTATLPGSPAKSPRVEPRDTTQSHNMDGSNDSLPTPPKDIHNLFSEAAESPQDTFTSSVAAEIDDMLDYFDGVTLPL